MSTYERRLKVTKTDAFVLNVSEWMASEPITGFTVEDSTGDGFLSIGATEIDGASLSVLLTGVSVGNQELIFSFTTATRSNSAKERVIVIAQD